jgi:hypothetical protein
MGVRAVLLAVGSDPGGGISHAASADMEIRIALGVIALAALAFYPALGLRRGGRTVALVVLGTGILLAPRIVPAGHPFGRALMAIAAVTVLVKLYDLHRGAERGRRPSAGEFAAFLPNIYALVWRGLDAEPRPSRRDDLRGLAVNLARLAAGGILVVVVFWIDWKGVSLVLEHCAKVVAVFLAIIPLSAVGASAWRLAGGRGRDFMDRPIGARTPADFWRRYNRPTQQFFYEDVFRPAGGVRRPIRAMLLTFGVSAVIHEYIFAIALDRVQGYQIAFFLIQGVAVAATWKVRPRGGRAVPWVAGTLAFNVATSALFFASVDNVLPFYARGRSTPAQSIPTTDEPSRLTPSPLAGEGTRGKRRPGGIEVSEDARSAIALSRAGGGRG